MKAYARMPAGAVKLCARTQAGLELSVDVWLSGQTREPDGGIRCVEIILPPGCDHVVDHRVEELPRTPSGDRLLWADPGDLCGDDGSPMNYEALLDRIMLVNDLRAEQLRRELLRGARA